MLPGTSGKNEFLKAKTDETIIISKLSETCIGHQ
jgi:hypothetical protein